MSPRERIQTIRLIEKKKKNKDFAKKITVEDSSYYKEALRENKK